MARQRVTPAAASILGADVALERRPNMVRGKAAILEKSRLLGPPAVITRDRRAELLAPNDSGKLGPVGDGIEMATDYLGGKLQLAQLRGDARRPLTAGDVVRHESLDVALVIKQVLGRKLLQHSPHRRTIEATFLKFALDLRGRVIAPR